MRCFHIANADHAPHAFAYPPPPRISVAGCLIVLTFTSWLPETKAQTTITVDAGIAQGAHKLISRSFSQGSSPQADDNEQTFWQNLQGRFRDLNTDLVRVSAGSLIYENADHTVNYSKMDAAIDSIVAAGGRPFVTMGLGADLTSQTETAAMITSLVARYKTRNNGAIAFWEIYNEPDHPTKSVIPNVTHYNNYYTFAVAAIRAGDPDAKIGGMALAEVHPNSTWMIPFLDHVKATRVTPSTTDDLPLDFVSFHFYNNGQGPHNNPNSILGDQIQWVYDWLQTRGLATEVMITEYNLSADLFTRSEEDYNAARTMTLIQYLTTRFYDRPLRLFNFQPKDGIHWEAGSQTGGVWKGERLHGGWGLLSVDNYAKPVYNALRLYANMPATRLNSYLPANPPAGLRVLASKSGWDATGLHEVLVWNDSYLPQDVRVYSYNMPFVSTTTKEYSRVDLDDRYGNLKYNVINAEQILADLDPATAAIEKTIPFTGSSYTTPTFRLKPFGVSKLVFKTAAGTAPPVPTSLTVSSSYQNTLVRWKDGAWVAARSQAETVASVTASDSITNLSNASASGGVLEQLNANAVNDYVTYSLPSIAEGTYTVKIGGMKGTTRGKFQVSIDGVNIGPEINQYHTAGTFEQYNLGRISFAAAGTRAVKFTVTGKHTSSTSHEVAVDYIELEPVDAYKTTGYNVLRSTSATGTYTAIARNITGTVFVDSQGNYNTNYYYKVEAVNQYGTSAASAASAAVKWSYLTHVLTGPIRYINRFDENSVREQLSNRVGNWNIVNGELVEGNTTSSTYSATLPGVTLSNGSVEFDLKIDGTGGWAGVELVNASDTYKVILFAHGLSNMFKNGTQVPGGQSGTNVYPRDDFQRFKVTYNASSKTIKAFFQGTQYLSYTEAGAMTPVTTIRLVRYNSYVTRFDNLEVSQFDNFLDPFSNVAMTNWKPSTGAWSVNAANALQQTSTSGTHMVSSPLVHLHNGSVEADIKLISATSSTWAGMCVKKTDVDATPFLPNAGYLVFIRGNGAINVRNNLTGANMLATDFMSGTTPLTTAVKLRVSFEDSVMKVYYNGITNSTLTFTDRSFSSGSVSLVTGSASATFDNVKVAK